MIEELKLVLDSIGDLTGVGLWIVGGFLVFKIITYLSTTGAFIFCLKLVVTNLYNYLTKVRVIKYETTINGRSGFIDASAKQKLDDLITSVCMSEGTGNYIHGSDISALTKAWEAYPDKKNKQ